MAIRCPKCRLDNPEDTLYCEKCGTELPPPEEIQLSQTETYVHPKKDLTTGSTFADRYQIIEELGKGGMGKVYKAFDKEIQVKVALKLIKPEIAADKDTIERFRNELKVARDISHKNICRMYDLGREAGNYYISMEYVPGEDLKDMIRMSGQLGVGTAVNIAKQVCEGLSEAHKLGVIHRDLKPSNIMIDRNGNVRIMDFGIARSIKGKGITGAGVIIGTPEYMSPEQVEGKEIDQRSDIYSLGVILYEMLTGRVPFEGDTPFTVGVKHKSEIPKDPREFNAHVPDGLSRLILKCLEKTKVKRYQSTDELRSELEKIEKGIPTAELAIPQMKPLTSKEITVKFNLKKVLIPSVTVIAVVILSVAIWRLLPQKEAAPAKPGRQSIAVLPFKDLSPAKDHEYFCSGIAETLISALTNIEGLWVPRGTSFFKGNDQAIDEIGRKLDVENILEGSVQVAEDKLRITARITNVRDGGSLWSEIFDRKMDDIFAIQDDIAKAIVKVLKIKLLAQKGGPLVKNYTENRNAYNLYLQGRYLWSKRGKVNLEKALGYFDQALGKDPNYALGYTGLADVYLALGGNGNWPPAEAFPKAKAAALKALEMDSNLAEAHASLAHIKFLYEWDFANAEEEFQKAIRINPGYPTAHQWHSYLLLCLGRIEEAIAEVKLARSLDPLSPKINERVGYFLYVAKQYRQALEELRKAIEVDSDNAAIYETFGLTYAETGQYEEAIKSYRRALELGGGKEKQNLKIGRVYALMGRREEARKILNNTIEDSKKDFISPLWIAEVFAALGEKDQVFTWLDKAFRERDYGLVGLKVKNEFNPVRSDPRFAEVLRKIGLEK